MRVVRATIVWVAAALTPVLEAAAQDKPKIEVVPQIGDIFDTMQKAEGPAVRSCSRLLGPALGTVAQDSWELWVRPSGSIGFVAKLDH
jgi:hypothetical protein